MKEEDRRAEKKEEREGKKVRGGRWEEKRGRKGRGRRIGGSEEG